LRGAKGGETMLEKKTETRLRRVGTAVIIDLLGDVTNRGQDTIKRAYEEALQGEPERVFFNFGDTEYINTSGIAVLISLVIEAEKVGRKIGLFGMSAHYHKVFTLVRLPLFADMYESESDALASL
jgi:anti-anti-sigma factor